MMIFKPKISHQKPIKPPLKADFNAYFTKKDVDILKKFNLTIDEFESFFAAGKFVKIAQKVTMRCAKCGKVVPIAGKTNMLCSACAKKLQNEI